MSDPYLAGIVSAAEQEKWFPPLRVVAGNTLFVGTPGPSRIFRDKAQYAIGEEHYYSQGGRMTKKRSEKQNAESWAHAEQVVAHLSAGMGSAETGEVLTMFDCQVWPASGGDGVEVPVVRIPLTAIDGWWPGAGRLLKAPSGGGWLFGFGLVVPVDAG